MSIVEPLADQLERRFGPCPSNRRDFLGWIAASWSAAPDWVYLGTWRSK